MRQPSYLRNLCLVSLSVALTAGAAACSDPAADKPKAQVGPAMSAATDATAAAAAASQAPSSGEVRSFAITPANSRIGFVGSKVTGSHVGEFKNFSGSVSLAEGSPLESGRVRVEIEMGSVDTDTDRLTSHLKSGDFFLVESFPTAVFESVALEPAADGDATHVVRGELTLRGVTKPVSFPARIERQGDVIVVESEFALNRKEFGIAYAGKPDDLIRDDVVISLTLRAAG